MTLKLEMGCSAMLLLFNTDEFIPLLAYFKLIFSHMEKPQKSGDTHKILTGRLICELSPFISCTSSGTMVKFNTGLIHVQSCWFEKMKHNIVRSGKHPVQKYLGIIEYQVIRIVEKL